jgi:hypothetical protein
VAEALTLGQYRMDNAAIDFLNRHCALGVLSEVLAKETCQMTGLERIVIAAIRWIGRGVATLQEPEKIIVLVTGIERLLISDTEQNRRGGSHRIARRASALLCSNPVDGREIRKQVGRLYDLRNQVVHTGRVSVPDEDLIMLEECCVSCLKAVAAHLGRFGSHHDLLRMLDNLRMSTSN